MTTTLTAPAAELDDITIPATTVLSATTLAAEPCESRTDQRLTIKVGGGEGWVSLYYSSTGDTVLTYLTAEDIRGYRSVEDALDTDTDIGTVVAANEWRRRPDGFTHWIAELEVSEHDPQILLAALAALAVMRTLTGLLAPVGLCVLQLQDALSNLLAGTGWTTLIDGAPALNSRTLIDALHAGNFLEEHDADAAELIARAYRNGGFEDADENTEIVHSSQLTVPAAV